MKLAALRIEVRDYRIFGNINNFLVELYILFIYKNITRRAILFNYVILILLIELYIIPIY